MKEAIGLILLVLFLFLIFDAGGVGERAAEVVKAYLATMEQVEGDRE